MTEFRRLHIPSIIVLLETHVSGVRADEIYRRIGFLGCYRVEAHGHAGGIWVLWDVTAVHLQLLKAHRNMSQ